MDSWRFRVFPRLVNLALEADKRVSLRKIPGQMLSMFDTVGVSGNFWKNA